ncbi:response regulator [bacterium]|nr:response regulator [bacterium]
MASRTALVIDLDTELADILTERLHPHDIEVIGAETGGEGMALARRMKPNLIVQELALPDISGFYLLGKIRAHESTFLIPVVILTHREDPDLEERAVRNGADYFSRKPYMASAFIPKLRELAWRSLSGEESRKAREIFKPPAPSRLERLVTERLEIEIRTEHHIMRGLTSGINENGLGAHVNLLEKNADDAPPLASGQACTIHFRSMKYPLMPCEGSVLRIEPSWDRKYRQFIAVKFAAEVDRGMDEADRMSLREWIREQAD